VTWALLGLTPGNHASLESESKKPLNSARLNRGRLMVKDLRKVPRAWLLSQIMRLGDMAIWRCSLVGVGFGLQIEWRCINLNIVSVYELIHSITC
jgi:hypothetical protein